jgi:hypothetical protein
MINTYGYTYKRGREMSEAEIQEAGAAQAEREAADALIGSKVACQWGKWRTYATITRVTAAGNIYAKRWNERRQCWTRERRIYEWRGIYAIEEYA